MRKNSLAVLSGALLGLLLAFLAFHFFSSILPSLLYRPPPPPPTARMENGYYVIHYEWRYPRGFGRTWSYDTKIKVEAYRWFRNRPRLGDYREYVDNPADDQWISHLAGLLENAARREGWGEFETLDFVLSFVQEWPYTSDDVTTGYDEYPRYPIETIVDGGGDCEDTSILFASLVKAMGYEVVFLLLEEDRHMAVGVAVSEEMVREWNRPYPLTYYRYNGKPYVYCETTEGWELGRKPERLKSTVAKIVPV